MKINKDVPVICAECADTGRIVKMTDGYHLTCELMNGKPIYGSKPKWCPKPPLFEENKRTYEQLTVFIHGGKRTNQEV